MYRVIYNEELAGKVRTETVMMNKLQIIDSNNPKAKDLKRTMNESELWKRLCHSCLEILPDQLIVVITVDFVS